VTAVLPRTRRSICCSSSCSPGCSTSLPNCWSRDRGCGWLPEGEGWQGARPVGPHSQSHSSRRDSPESPPCAPPGLGPRTRRRWQRCSRRRGVARTWLLLSSPGAVRGSRLLRSSARWRCCCRSSRSSSLATGTSPRHR